jgi:small subunit ribosomal protein S1
VTQVLDNGIEVSVAGGATGFIRKSDLSRDRSEQRPNRFAVGEKVDAKITAIDSKTRKITLSIKQREVEEEKEAMASYGSAESGASLGDILGAAISKAAQEREASEDESETKTKETKAKAGKKKQAAAEGDEGDEGDAGDEAGDSGADKGEGESEDEETS